MKILYIADNSSNDFLSDSVFHGLHQLSELEIIDSNYLWYMYNDISKDSLVNRFHGRGFTYYADIPFKKIDRDNIEEKIQDKYFDFVVYGNAKRCLDFFEMVKKLYEKNRIIILDGEDLFYGDINTYQTSIDEDITSYVTFYKRELNKDSKNIKPISFAFPENKIPRQYENKQKVLAQIIPGVSETFIFTKEEDYFMDYQTSMFAYTWRKAGWDCLRHYEILCNNCVPLFLDIEYCPKQSCATIPKDLLIEYYKKSGIYDLFEMDKEFVYNDGGNIILNRDLTIINNIDINDNFIKLYYEYLQKISDYAKKNLTTKKLAQYILNVI
jgi:hypothetical protein